jgi:glycosyltransferase involved in cell wall biosynthesis
VKVLHLTTVDMSLELLLAPILDDAIRRGYEVVGVSAAGPFVPRIEQRGVRHVPLRSSTRRFDLLADIRTAVEFWKILRAERPDVLHTHNPKPGLYGRVLGRLARVPVIVNTVHGLYASPDDRLAKRALVYAAEFVGGHCSHGELVHNPEDLELMTRLHLAPRRNLHRLGSGIDVDRFSTPDPIRSLTLRAEWGVSDSDVLVGTVGRLVAEKGIPELLKAVEGLQGARLVVVGGPDPDKPDAVPASVIDAARRNGVIFAGFRSDMAEVYGALDIFVLASHREGFPLSGMEAAAAGLPIVTTDIRGCRQVVTDGVNGLLVPVRSPERLRGALGTLVGDPGLRKRLGAASRLRAVEEFDQRAVVARVFHCYEEVAERRGLGWPADQQDW